MSEEYIKIKQLVSTIQRRISVGDFPLLYKKIREELNIHDPQLVYNCLNTILYKKRILADAEEVKIPTKYQGIDKQFNFLASIPEIPQKSPEWYEKRHNLITASSCAEALGENKYTTREKFLVQKCLPDPPFEQNITTHHGIKYEDIATMIYEELFDVSVKPFGLIGHPTVSFIGA